MSFKVLGLCGGSGSGKSAASVFFAKSGYLPINADIVYRELTDKCSPCLDALVCAFGNDILNSHATLDRKKLAEIVFSDKNKLSELNHITHKFILDEIRNIISKAKEDGYRGALVDAPLLYESGFDSECDFIIAVVADLDIRIARITDRDSISVDAAIKRISSQKTDTELRDLADFVIENNADIYALEHEVAKIISKIT